MARIVVTGAFGNVGTHVVSEFATAGHTVWALDAFSKKTRAAQRRLRERHDVTVVWGDLSADTNAFHDAVVEARPDAIVHLAAVIPPFAYLHPRLAHEVNIEGTRRILAAAHEAGTPRVIFASSYTVHGIRNPYRELAPINEGTPVNPADPYGRHKAAGEALLKASGLPWTILRLPAVGSLDPNFGRDPAFLRLASMIPVEQRRHGCDVRDIARAFAHAAVEPAAVEQVLEIGGDPSWRLTAREHMAELMRARELPPPPDAMFRRADPGVDDAWYYEDAVDPGWSQALLDYQRHSFADYLGEVARQSRTLRRLARPVARLVPRLLARHSPYFPGDGGLDRRSVADHIAEQFGTPRQGR